MQKSVAIVGAGVSGLTCGALFAERGYRAEIFAAQIGQQTTSSVAAAMWFPYDAEPADKVIPWALATYDVLVELARDPATGVSMIELRQFSRTGQIEIPEWAIPFGASAVGEADTFPSKSREFTSGFSIAVPLMDTTVYLDYLTERFRSAGGEIHAGVCFEKLEDVDQAFDLLINCAGIGARKLVNDTGLEPHRGQVVIVQKLNDLPYAMVCDDAPLMYAIPRTNDCVFGGTNELSDNLNPDPKSTSLILAECSRVLSIDNPSVVAERVGLRPFRKSGVRLETTKLRDGRTVVHNYGHGGSGFTLSWGCAREVMTLANG